VCIVKKGTKAISNTFYCAVCTVSNVLAYEIDVKWVWENE